MEKIKKVKRKSRESKWFVISTFIHKIFFDLKLNVQFHIKRRNLNQQLTEKKSAMGK